jgi:hypothetical protein
MLLYFQLLSCTVDEARYICTVFHYHFIDSAYSDTDDFYRHVQSGHSQNYSVFVQHVEENFAVLTLQIIKTI